MVPVEPPVVMTDDPIKKIPVEGDALIITNEPPVTEFQEEDVVEKPASASLFSMMDNSSASEKVESKELPAEESKKSIEVSFTDTDDLIDHQIEAIDDFIASLDLTDKTTLAEEAEYELQKEHFTELEIQADMKHKKNLVERAHAEEMKVYLKKQKTHETEATVTESEENKTDDSEQEAAIEDEVSPKPTKKKEWSGFKKKDDEEEEQSKEVFL